MTIPKKFQITCNTKYIKKGSTFVAIKGFKEDGNKYIEKAISLGATKIISEYYNATIKNICAIKNIKYELVKNARKTLAQLAKKNLNNQKLNLKIIGITGTKGKTTTTYIIKHILKDLGFKTALIGTIKNKILDQEIESINTTPESDYLQNFLRICENKKVDYLIMEVSSHALSLYRTYGIKFESIGFTNLNSEHMDFYKNMNKYFYAKYKIFNQIKNNGNIIINIDDKWGKKAFKKLKNKKQILSNIIPFSIQNYFDSFKKYQPKNLFGNFNLYNIIMAFLICKNLGLSEKKIKKSILKFKGIAGRLQLHILKNKCKAFVDYAHNPSSIKALLQTIYPLTNDLIVVFGCGGDRDKTKRPIMGKITSEYANKIILTDDNPRFENPQNIINEILTGIDKKNINKIHCELNRKKAIEKAVKLSTANSIIAILGKGHENYHIVKNKKYYFDDYEEIKKY